MPRFQSHPSVVEAVRHEGNFQPLEEFAGTHVRIDPGSGSLELLTGVDGAQGWVPVPVGHWLLRSAATLSGSAVFHFWPVDPDEFAVRYSEVVSPEDVRGFEGGGYRDHRDALRARVAHDLATHPPVYPYIGEAMDLVRASALRFAEDLIDYCATGRELSTALTKVEEALFFGVAAIARYQPERGEAIAAAQEARA